MAAHGDGCGGVAFICLPPSFGAGGDDADREGSGQPPPRRMAFVVTRLLGSEAMLAAGTFLALLGVLVLAARPRRPLNLVSGALLVTQGAETVAFQLIRQSADVGEAVLWFRLSSLLDPVVVFLTALLLHLLFPPARTGGRWRAWALWTVAALCAVFLLAPLYDWRAMATDVVRPTAGGWFTTLPTPLSDASRATGMVVRAAAVLLAAQAVVSPHRSATERKQAALVGLSFVFLVGHVAALRAARAPLALAETGGLLPATYGTPWPPLLYTAGWVAGVLTALLALAAILLSLPRLASAFEGRARPAASAAVLAALAFGLLDGLVSVVAPPVAAWYVSSRFLWVSAAAACLALALVRFDLGGLGERTRRRVTTLAHVSMVLLAVVLPAGLVLRLGGGSSAAIVLALLLALGALTLSPAPLRVAARALAALLLVDPRDAAAAGESAPAYAAALEARLGPGGVPPPADGPGLAALREELGLQEHDHARIAELVRARHAQPGQPLLLGRYRVERELGRGAHGAAYLATHAGTGERVVVKRIHAGDAERRILAEARALQAVRHPRVVPLVDVDRAGREAFLVLGYVEGGTAQDLLEREGPLPPARAIGLALDVLEGLSALHAAGIVHADVKPGNVLLDAEGRGVLADLGSAIVPRPDEGATLTAGAGAGTLATLAPERLRGAGPRPAADLYAVGATLYRLLTGQDYVDLQGKGPLGAGEAIAHEPPRLPHPRVPATVGAVLVRALAKRPEDRYGGADEMREALLAAVAAEAAALPRRP